MWIVSLIDEWDDAHNKDDCIDVNVEEKLHIHKHLLSVGSL